MIATKASEITMCTNRITLLLIVDDRKVDLYTFCLDNCPFHFIYFYSLQVIYAKSVFVMIFQDLNNILVCIFLFINICEPFSELLNYINNYSFILSAKSQRKEEETKQM